MEWRQTASPLRELRRDSLLSPLSPTKETFKAGMRLFLPDLASITAMSIIHGQIGLQSPGNPVIGMTTGAFSHPVIGTKSRSKDGKDFITCHAMTSWSSQRVEERWPNKPDYWKTMCPIKWHDEAAPAGTSPLSLDPSSGPAQKRSYVFRWNFEIEAENLRFDSADAQFGRLLLDEASLEVLNSSTYHLEDKIITSLPPRRNSNPNVFAPQSSPLLAHKRRRSA